VKQAKFDPIAVERALVECGQLPERLDSGPGELGPLEDLFIERDLRKYALWRISMVRQFKLNVIQELTNDDLFYLAGQSPEGYIGREQYGVQTDRNKITQNAIRARIELDVRTTHGAWRRTILLSLATFLLGVLASVGTLWLQTKLGTS
jgi:hypothetical protein